MSEMGLHRRPLAIDNAVHAGVAQTQSSNLAVEAPNAGRSPPAIPQEWELWCTTRSTARHPSRRRRDCRDANEKGARVRRAGRAMRQLQNPWMVLVNHQTMAIAR